MQSVGRHKYDFISTYTILHFLSELLHSHTPGMGVVVLHLWMYYWGRCVSFCNSLCTNSACLGSLQYWLGYIGKCETNTHINPRATVFSQKLNDHLMHLFHDVPQSMGYNYVQNRKSAATGHSNGQYRDQYSRWRHRITFGASGPRTVHQMFPTHAQNAFNFELWLSRNVKAVLKQNYHVEKNQVG